MNESLKSLKYKLTSANKWPVEIIRLTEEEYKEIVNFKDNELSRIPDKIIITIIKDEVKE